MPERNVFLCRVAVVEELAAVFVVVLAIGSAVEGFFDRRWSQFWTRRDTDITTIGYKSGSANLQEEADQKTV
jgi:hypothetical protein